MVSLDDIVNAVVKPIKDFVQWIADWIVDSLKWVYKQIIQPIFDAIENFISDIYQGIKWTFDQSIGSLMSMVQIIWNEILKIGRIFEGGIKAIVNPVIDAFVSTVEIVRDWIESSVKVLWENIIGVVNGITAQITQGLEWVKNIIMNALDQAWSGIVTFFENIYAELQSIYADLLGGINSIFSFIQNLPKAFTDALNSAWKGLCDGFKWMFEGIMKGLSGVTSWIMDNIIDPIKNGLDDVWKKITSFFKNLWQGLVDTISNLFPERSAVNITEAPTQALKLWGTTLSMGLMAHGVSKALEYGHPFKEVGFGQISGFLADLGNFKQVGDSVLGPIFSSAVYFPMKYHSQDRYRPYIPKDDMLMTLAYKEDITMEKFYDSMGYLGYDDFWIKAIETTMYKEPKYFELIFMVEDNFTDPRWLENKLRRSGYSEKDVPNVIVGLTKRTMKSDRNNYTNALIELYKEGYLTDQEFDRGIRRLDFNVGSESLVQFDKHQGKFVSFELELEHKGLIKAAAMMEYRLRILIDYKMAYVEQFRRGYITTTDLKLKLTSLGLGESRIESLITLEKIRAEPDLREQLLKEKEDTWKDIQYKYTTKYSILYKNNQINEAQFYEFLKVLNIDPELARITVELEYMRKFNEELPENLLQI